MYLLLTCCLATSVLAKSHKEKRIPRFGLNNYITRPDIKAPKWYLNVHHPDLVSPGYWFLAPREPLGKKEQIGGWIGPAIYDNNGELIWGGAPMFGNTKVDDFRISNVDGEELMTLLHDEEGAGIILGNDFEVRKKVALEKPHELNTHEFHFVENGTRVIVIKAHKKMATEEDAMSIGMSSDGCTAEFDGFLELDTKTWGKTFSWSSYGRIGLNESAWDDRAGIEAKCKESWDYVHINSVDKIPDGDYLVCARFTNAIYKVSARDGSIIWRLGALRSDFEISDDVKFSGQHSVRHVSSNDTHMLISILDNAKVNDLPPTHDSSRGLILTLDTKNITVSVEAEYPHPAGIGGYARARGNYQTLPNGNVFIGWSEQATQSEYTSNGTLVMDAKLMPSWLGSYRNYKFDFVGNPKEKPAVVSRAVRKADSVQTEVHVSWNGATEVTAWDLFEATPDGETVKMLNYTRRAGFETQIIGDGFVKYVILRATSSTGHEIGRSDVIETEVLTEATMEENHPLTHSEVASRPDGLLLPIRDPHFALIVIMAIACAGYVLFRARRRRARPSGEEKGILSSSHDPT